MLSCDTEQIRPLRKQHPRLSPVGDDRADAVGREGLVVVPHVAQFPLRCYSHGGAAGRVHAYGPWDVVRYRAGCEGEDGDIRTYQPSLQASG